MPEKESIFAEEIVHIVPSEPYHFLYLRSGIVVQFNPLVGTLAHTVRLPSYSEIRQRLDLNDVGTVDLSAVEIETSS